jgi:hypothetical protein
MPFFSVHPEKFFSSDVSNISNNRKQELISTRNIDFNDFYLKNFFFENKNNFFMFKINK